MADEPRLTVALAARLDEFEKQLKQAGVIAEREVAAIEGITKNIAVGTTIGNLAAQAIVKAFELAGDAIKFFIDMEKQAIADLDKLNDHLKITGQTADEFLRILHAARSTGVKDETVFGDTAKLAAALDELRYKTNDLSKFLDANNIKWKDQHGLVINTGQALRIVAHLMERAATENEKIKILEKFKLTKEWTKALGDGLDAFEQMQAAARIDPQLEKNRKIIEEMGKLVTFIKGEFASFGSSLITQFAPALVEALIKPLQTVAQIMQEMTSGTIFETQGRDLAERLLGISERARQALENLNKPARTRFTVTKGVKGLGDAKEADEEADAMKRATDQLQKRQELLLAEQKTIGLNVGAAEEARQIALLTAAAKKAGLEVDEAVTKELRDQAALVGKIRLENVLREDRFNKLVESSKEFGSALSEAFKGLVLEGKKLDEIIKNLSNRLAGKAIDRIFDLFFAAPPGGGSTGFMKLLGLGRAGGGPVGAGNPYIVGEKGPELFVPDRAGRIIPNNALGGARGNVSIGGSTVVVQGSADDAALVAIRQALTSHERKIAQTQRALVSTQRFQLTGVM